MTTLAKPATIKEAVEQLQHAKADYDIARQQLTSITARREAQQTKLQSLTEQCEALQKARPQLLQAVSDGSKPERALADHRNTIRALELESEDARDLHRTAEQAVHEAERALRDSEGQQVACKRNFYRQVQAEMQTELSNEFKEFLRQYWAVCSQVAGSPVHFDSILHSLLDVPKPSALSTLQ